VLHHLLLMRTARLQDLRSQAVVQQVAEKLGTPDVVRHLYVFSYADTRAVSERSWTSLDHLDLEELYSRLLASLAPAGADNDRERMGQIRRRLSAAASQGEEAVRRHCDALPASYILNTPLEKIAMHIGLLERLEAEDVVVDIYNRPGEGFSEVTVCAYDDPRPGLLAKITGVLYACDSEILRAQVFTLEKRERPVVLDTLWVRSSGHALSERRAARVRSGLRSVLLGDRSVAQLVEEGRKTMPEGLVVDSLDLRNDLSEEHTVIHIIARDLRGLLFLMTKAISNAGLHIHSAKVATWSARAENNFYTTDAQGAQLAGGELPAWRTLLLECLGIGGKPQ